MTDVLRSRDGCIGSPYRHAHEPPHVELIFCNPDFLWRNDFPRHRFALGVFREAFQSVYKVSERKSNGGRGEEGLTEGSL